MNNMKKFLLIILFMIFITGCGNDSEKVQVMKINKTEAVTKIEDGAILIDVRSSAEYESRHIDGAININVDDILNSNGSLVYDNSEIGFNKTIIVYCRSGSRSNNAANKLIELGYTNVYDLGSIDNWN